MATKTSARLKFLNEHNAETHLPSHSPSSIITPPGLHFLRARTSPPDLARETWGLDISGEVRKANRFSLDDLEDMKHKSMTVTMACAGIGRSAIKPKVISGEQWETGAVSTAIWTGIPISALLSKLDVKGSASKLIITGADGGHRTDDGKIVNFQRRIDLTDALEGDAMIAIQMNNEMLPLKHGYPARFLMPGWYAMASPKWITSIEFVSEERRLFYNDDRYVKVDRKGKVVPVKLMDVNSVAAGVKQLNGNNARLLHGFAWSGYGAIKRVEISMDEGKSWRAASIAVPKEKHAWQSWHYIFAVEQMGGVNIMSRAEDSKGNIQPMAPVWNKHGYANNAVHQFRLS